MPWLEGAVARLNVSMNQAIQAGDMGARARIADFFDDSKSIADLFGDSDLHLNPQGRPIATFGEWPEAVWKATRSAIRSALLDANVGSITISWTAGYDYNVAVHASTPFDGSPAGVTINITTRYPFDPHPTTTAAS